MYQFGVHRLVPGGSFDDVSIRVTPWLSGIRQQTNSGNARALRSSSAEV